MRYRSDTGPLFAIALGAALSLGMAAWLRGPGFVWSYRVDRTQAAVEAAENGTALGGAFPAPICRVGFYLRSDPSDWSVTGNYDGFAKLVPEGLDVELVRGSTLAAENDAQVRGLVLGLAESSGDSWVVTHAAEPVPVGALHRGEAQQIPPRHVLIPGVGLEQLANGWLVAEHVIDAPGVEGGTAWTYVHADRATLRPLLDASCAG